MGRRIISVGLVLFLAVCSQAAETIFNVDVFWGWGGCYRPMEWTPIDIGVTSTLDSPFEGSLLISAPQDSLNTMNIHHGFVLTPSIPLHLPLVTKLAFTAETANVRLTDAKGRTRWQYSYRLWDFSNQPSSLTPVQERDLLIGFVGRRKFGISQLDQKTICVTNSGTGMVYLKDKLGRIVPWDWTGFSSLDLLMLYDTNWSELNRQQLNAIKEWVQNGGRLLIVMGSEPLAADNPIAQMLPFEIEPSRQMELPAGFLSKFGLNSQKSETVVRWPMKERSDSNAVGIEKFDSGDIIFATSYIGFGRVGVLGFDPEGLSGGQASNSASFWVEIISKVLDDSSAALTETRSSSRSARVVSGFSTSVVLQRRIAINDQQKSGPEFQDTHSFAIGGPQLCSNAVMGYFYNLPQLRPLSIIWVILLFALLALLLGPVDYFVLKRLDKQPLTWLTSCFWIILFSAGAYYGVAYLRGGRLTFRAVSVLDGIKKTGCSWSTTYSGLFAPSSADYKIEGLANNQWWSGISPTANNIYRYSEQGPGRSIYFDQFDGKNIPSSLPVSIWTMQCLMTETKAEKLPIDAEVRCDGKQAAVKIINQSQTSIKKGYVLFKDNEALAFESVPAMSTKEFTGQLSFYQSWLNDEQVYSRADDYYYSRYGEDYSSVQLNRNSVLLAEGTNQRSRTISAYLANGAAVVCAEFDDSPLSYKLKNRSCLYEHIQLVRLVVLNAN